jgi:hypothetical protein
MEVTVHLSDGNTHLGCGEIHCEWVLELDGCRTKWFRITWPKHGPLSIVLSAFRWRFICGPRHIASRMKLAQRQLFDLGAI